MTTYCGSMDERGVFCALPEGHRVLLCDFSRVVEEPPQSDPPPGDAKAAEWDPIHKDWVCKSCANSYPPHCPACPGCKCPRPAMPPPWPTVEEAPLRLPLPARGRQDYTDGGGSTPLIDPRVVRAELAFLRLSDEVAIAEAELEARGEAPIPPAPECPSGPSVALELGAPSPPEAELEGGKPVLPAAIALTQHIASARRAQDEVVARETAARATIGRLEGELGALRNEHQVLVMRAQDAAHMLIEELGSTGPENVDETAKRACDALRKARAAAERVSEYLTTTPTSAECEEASREVNSLSARGFRQESIVRELLKADRAKVLAILSSDGSQALGEVVARARAAARARDEQAATEPASAALPPERGESGALSSSWICPNLTTPCDCPDCKRHLKPGKVPGEVVLRSDAEFWRGRHADARTEIAVLSDRIQRAITASLESMDAPSARAIAILRGEADPTPREAS